MIGAGLVPVCERAYDSGASSGCSEEYKANVKDCTVDSDGEVSSEEAAEEGVDDVKFLGVRGPQSLSVLEPKDCSKLVRIARDIEVRRRGGDLSMAHFRRSLRQEADFVPEEMFDALAAAFEDLQQLHRVLQLALVRIGVVGMR